MIKASRIGAWARAAAILAGLAVFVPRLFPAPISNYRKAEPRNGRLIRAVPFEKWLQRNYCGPACLEMVFGFWGGAAGSGQRAIADRIFDRASQATPASDLVLYPRTKGFSTRSFQGGLTDLKGLVRNGIPVIVLTDFLKQVRKGHFRVVVGYDDDEGLIIFHDPCFGPLKAMKAKRFLKAWSRGKGRTRWGLAVVPAGAPFPFPALGDEPQTSIDLARAYYRRGDFAASRAQWEKVREARPGDPQPVYSLAMVLLKEGRPMDAEASAREALRLDAESPFALDVLGLAYASEGNALEALRTLGRAMRLGSKERFIRDHYLQVRARYIEKARSEIILKEEASHGRTR
jgi:tetratricopeptide (TPR) repeat protein